MASSRRGDGGSSGEPSLAALLCAWRDRALLTQEQLAERSGLAVRTIRRLESGDGGRPRGGSLLLLADALGLTDAERAQLRAVARGEPADPTPAAGVPRQLPADARGFTGRGEHLRRLDALLADERAPTAVVISAIAGTAGVGKTALAIHWAHRQVDRFPDGQLAVNLGGYGPGPPTSPIQALSLLLRGLGVEGDQVPVDVEAAGALYRSTLAGRRLLVVLDNARDAEQVRPLLPGSPGCLVVVTSRDRLSGLVASHGAHRLLLDVLSPSEAVALLARVVGEERVAAEPEAAAELAALCGHLPLALRIAAANLADEPGRSIGEYASALRTGDRLARLQVDGDPRAAVGNAFDHSYAALDEPPRRLFRLLGLVPGPDFDAPAAAALAGAPAELAARLLARLARAHLLEERAPGRYAFHDLLRRYAADRARSEEAEVERGAAIERLFAWYLHGVDTAVTQLYPRVLRLPTPPADARLPAVSFGEPSQALRWLDAERTNLVVAVVHAAGHGPLPVAWLLMDALRGYFWMHRHRVDWLAGAEASVAAAAAAGDLRAQAAARNGLATVQRSLGRYEEMTRQYTLAVDLAERSGWIDGQVAALMNLASAQREVGDLQTAARHLARALAATPSRPEYRAAALITLGNVEAELGRLADAHGHHSEAVDIHRRLGSSGGEVEAVANLGGVDHAMGDLDSALARVSMGLAGFRQAGNQRSEGYALTALGAVHRDAGRHAEALECAHAGLALARDLGDRRGEAHALNVVGGIHLRRGARREAIRCHQRALVVAGEAGVRLAEAEALLGVAEASRREERHADAVESARRALEIAGRAGYGLLEGDAHTILAGAHLALGRRTEARREARAALDLHRATGQRIGEARTLLVLGRLLGDAGDAAGAASAWRDALAIFDDIGTPEADDVRVLLDSEPRA
ncbi:MAG TPA: tetratricopeptide repeat protein [Candidatus Dormibacteraeota bacterium]